MAKLTYSLHKHLHEIYRFPQAALWKSAVCAGQTRGAAGSRLTENRSPGVPSRAQQSRMADYIYTMELRLTPNQQKGVTLVQDIARAAGMNVYLTGGAVRDIISGLPIRDLDFTVQGNPLKLQKDFERAGAVIGGADDDD